MLHEIDYEFMSDYGSGNTWVIVEKDILATLTPDVYDFFDEDEPFTEADLVKELNRQRIPIPSLASETSATFKGRGWVGAWDEGRA